MAINKELMKTFCKETLPITKEEYESMSQGMSPTTKKKFFNVWVKGDGTNYYEYICNPDDDEIGTALLFKICKDQAKYLRSIKNMLTFFTVLTVIGMIAGIILVLMQLD